MTEQEAIDYVKLHAQTESFPALESAMVESVVRRHQRASIWTADTDYKIGDKVQPTVPNGHFYECVSPGQSDSVEPDWTLSTHSRMTEFASDLVWRECETDFDGNIYNLRSAVHEAWILKAGCSANQFDVSIDQQKWHRSQVHDHCLSMAQRYIPID
ncbi:MAG TPA: hypothetical protein VF556_17680 [Pyrinomonadaceae bacterium]|jgi:hypothetical protein